MLVNCLEYQKKMKLFVYMSLLVAGLFTHTDAYSAENSGRVIKVFPQGNPIIEGPQKKELLEVTATNKPVEDKIIGMVSEPEEQAKHTKLDSNVFVKQEEQVQLGSNVSKLETPLNETNSENKSKELEFELQSGLLKPQLDQLVSKYLPTHEIYWGSYEGKHEWYGNQVIKGESVESLLNQITSSYGKPPKGIAWYIHRNVVEFVYKNKKG